MNMSSNWPKGLKRTKTREAVYSVLSGETRPVSAYNLSTKLDSIGRPICLSTVYRILDSFCKYGLARKITTSDCQNALFDAVSSEHKHYAVCCDCHSMMPIDICPIEEAAQNNAAEKSKFHVLGHNFELYGYCDDCYKKNKRAQ